MKMKNSDKLMKVQVGDSVIFAKDEKPFVIKSTNYRYALACTVDGSEYTIIDKKEKVLASTTQLFEEYSDFNKEENAQKMLDMLHSGERELSRKYRDTFSEFDAFGMTLGSKVVLSLHKE